MNFIQLVLSFLPTWVYNIVNRIAADQVVPQPDHQVTQKLEIQPGTQPESSSHKARRRTKACDELREVNIQLESDLNRRERENQQEFAKLKRQQRLLECKLTNLMASKDEKSDKMEKLMSRCRFLQKEIDNFRSDFICKDQRYQSELENLKERGAALAEKNTRLLAMKDEQLENMRNFLSHRDVISKDNDILRSELDRQQVEYQKELEKQRQRQVQLAEEKVKVLAFKNFKLEKIEKLLSDEEKFSRHLKEQLWHKEKILAFKNSVLEKMKRLFSDQNLFSGSLKQELNEVRAKLLMKEAESMSHDSLIKQFNEELSKARDSKQKLAEELSKKEAEYLTISQVKDKRIKELEVALSAIKEKARTEKPNEKRPQRIVYDRDTLMQLKNSVAFLGNRQQLADLGILRESDSLKSLPTNEGVKLTARTFGQLVPEMEQGHRPKREIKLIRSQDNPKTCDNPNVWKPKRASLKTEDEVMSTEATLKTVRGILNKLTPSNYKKLLQKVEDVNIDNQDCLAGVIKVFFEKAVDEPMFSPTYAQMCLALSEKNVLSSSNAAETVSFRKLLLLHCQKKFEKDSADLEHVESKRKEVKEADTEKKKILVQQELNELVDKNRRLSLGNIKFIGELFKIGMISFNEMHKCIRQLLNQDEDEESLECLCKLLTTIGKEIERPLVTDEAAKANRVQFMNSVIQSLNTTIGARKISNRLRFMIQDILELRKAAWKPRRAENGPQVIEPQVTTMLLGKKKDNH